MNDLLVVKDIIKYILDRISEKTPAADDKKLSHKAWRRRLKKMRRRESRQAYARDRRDSQRREQEEYYRVQSKVEAKRKEEEASREKHEEWVAREEVSQKEFQKKREDEAEKQRIKEEKEKKIREEWEAKEREEEKQRQIQRQKNEMLHNEMRGVDQQHRRHDDRYNPEAYNQKLAPTNWTGVSSDLFGTELDPRNCKFYIKTGACRFGNKCTRIHLKFENSPTIMIQNFFSDARLAIPVLNEHNNDSALEFDEVELIKDYERFYEDVIEEFRDAGNVVMFKCCQNFMPYLRGNVYVQYSTHEGAMRALQKFNGRWYAGRQLSVELSPVTNWKSSICGLFDKRLCPRGKTCNFLHVFRNPGNAYSVPNRTDFDPERACKTGYDPKFINTRHPVFAYYSQRDNIGGYGYRREDAIKHESVERSKKYWDNNTKNCDDDYRSKKRSKRSRSRSYSSRSRSRSRSRRKRSSHSRSRTRSRSKDKKRSRKDSRSSNSSRSSRRSKKEGSVSSTSTEWSDLSEDVPPEP